MLANIIDVMRDFMEEK
jgi:hypothetical protein